MQQELAAPLGMGAGRSGGYPQVVRQGRVWQPGPIPPPHPGAGQLRGAGDQPSWAVAGAGTVLSMKQPIFLSQPLLLWRLTVQTDKLTDGDRQADSGDRLPSALHGHA